MTCNSRNPMGIFLYREREACFWCHTETSNPLRFEKIELPAKLLDYFVWSNKSNIHQCMCGWWGRSVYVWVMGTTTKGMWIWIQQRKWKMCDTKNKQYVISSQKCENKSKTCYTKWKIFDTKWKLCNTTWQTCATKFNVWDVHLVSPIA